MSCKSRLTIEYKNQDIEVLVRENPTWSREKINAELIKKYGWGRANKFIGDIKKRVLKEIGYKRPKGRYEKWKKDPKDTGFWG